MNEGDDAKGKPLSVSNSGCKDPAPLKKTVAIEPSKNLLYPPSVKNLKTQNNGEQKITE